MKRTLLLFVILAALLTSMFFWDCKKDKSVQSFTVDGKIIFKGAIAADGCDWMVQVDTTSTLSLAHAENLSKNYEVNNLKVRLTYHIIGKHGFQCGQVPLANNPNARDIIAIDTIMKR